MNKVVEIFAVFVSRPERVVVVDFIRKFFPVGLFELPVFAEQPHGKDRGVLVFVLIVLQFDECIDFFNQHFIGDYALGVLKNAEQKALGAAVMVRKASECRA